MTRFFLALIRFTALALSFVLSTLVAAGFVTFVLFLGSDASWLTNDPSVALGSFGFLTGVWLVLCQALFAPFCLIILAAEFLRWSSLMINLLLGGLCALVFMVLRQSEISSETGLPYAEHEIWLAALSAGFVGGLTHWILAGHRAGRWLGPQSAPAFSEDHESAR